MLRFLRLITKFDQDFIAGESESHIILNIIALRLDVVEYIVRLLDKSTFKLDSLRSVKAELLFENGFSLLSRFLFLLDLLRSLGIELLNKWFSSISIISLSAKLKVTFIFVVTLVANAV